MTGAQRTTQDVPPDADTWSGRRRSQAQRIRDRAPARRRLLFWILWGVPWFLLVAAAWVAAKLAALGTRTKRFVTRDVPAAPRKIKAGVAASGEEISTRRGRRALLRALLDDRGLTQRRRIALLTLTCIVLGLAWLIMEIATFAFWRELLPFKHETDLLLFYGIGTRLFLPTPFEVLLLRSAAVIGPATAILVASIGATVGSWILFILGAQANKGLKVWTEKREWARKGWAWLERNAERFGYVLMGVILSIPFSPDAVTAVFTVLGLQMRWFLLTIFLSCILRLALFLWLFA